MDAPANDRASALVDASGKRPARSASDACPTCGKGKEYRQVLQTFGGPPFQACTNCGHQFREGA